MSDQEAPDTPQAIRGANYLCEAPGTTTARRKGCTCPSMDNGWMLTHYVWPAQGEQPGHHWWISEACFLHVIKPAVRERAQT